MIHLDLEPAHFQIILQSLGKQPYEIVAPVFAAMAPQVQAQQNPVPPGGVVEPPRPAGNGGTSG